MNKIPKTSCWYFLTDDGETLCTSCYPEAAVSITDYYDYNFYPSLVCDRCGRDIDAEDDDFDSQIA